nr:ankyrin repeat domain-containing protein SOWAHC [Nothobranchius furzeri]
MYRRGSEPAVGMNTDAHDSRAFRRTSVVERVARYGMPVMPGALQRRSRLQRQQEDGSAPERSSLTTTTRKKYLKELLLSNSLSSVLSCHTLDENPQQDADWALYPMEHAWMLSAVEGNYETILEFISEDPFLLTRRDFISGYSVLHWLAKRGQDETLLRLLRYAERAELPVNVNVRGSGGLTPLHVASMHRQYTVIKLLVGAFGANVDAMDYNGRRAWQYLRHDAPLEMKELLGTWDDEHSGGAAQHPNKNANNNCAGPVNSTACDELDSGETEEVSHCEQKTRKRSSRKLGSIKKLMSSIRGKKS